MRDLGGTYHSGALEDLAGLAPDVVVECTGAGPVVLAVMRCTARNAVVCLTGLSTGGRTVEFDA